MKKYIFILVAFFTISGLFYTQTNAQDGKVKTKSNIKNDRVCLCTVSSTGTGCEVSFDMEAPRDVATGQATGKRQHSPIRFMVSSSDNSVMEVTSPRDPASGQASGKVAGNPIGGLTIKGGKNPGGNQFNKIVVTDGSFTLPDDGPDGDYTLIMSWSWGMSQSTGTGNGSTGGGKARCNVSFTVTKVAGSWDLAVAKK